MTRSLQDIERDIWALDSADRDRLIRDLVAELSDGEDSDSIERAWRFEAQRRLDELRHGVVTAEPARKVFQRARAAR